MLPKGITNSSIVRVLRLARCISRLTAPLLLPCLHVVRCTEVPQQKVFEYRSRGRLPALTYMHKNGHVIFRASQPKAGVTKTRCKDDEVRSI